MHADELLTKEEQNSSKTMNRVRIRPQEDVLLLSQRPILAQTFQAHFLILASAVLLSSSGIGVLICKMGSLTVWPPRVVV